MSPQNKKSIDIPLFQSEKEFYETFNVFPFLKPIQQQTWKEKFQFWLFSQENYEMVSEAYSEPC